MSLLFTLISYGCALCWIVIVVWRYFEAGGFVKFLKGDKKDYPYLSSSTEIDRDNILFSIGILLMICNLLVYPTVYTRVTPHDDLGILTKGLLLFRE